MTVKLRPGSPVSRGMRRLRSAAIRRSGLRQFIANAVEREIHRQVGSGRLTDEVLRRPEVRTRLRHDVEPLVSAAMAKVEPLVGAAVAKEWEALRQPADVNREFTSDVLYGRGGRFDRTLSAARWNALAAQITELSGARDVRWTMQQAYRALLAAEYTGIGRVAGSTYNVVGKLALAPLLAPPVGPVMEIGSLFGLFAPAMLHQLRRSGSFPQLTVVDPLEGTQIQPGTVGGTDPTGTPVTREVLEQNFNDAGLRPADYRVVQGYSSDAAVQAEAGDRSYSVVIVDGDHSESGVYADLWWVQDLVLPGGIVVMDDFGDPKWRGVETAGRRYLADGGQLELLGCAATSAYLRMP